MAITRHIQFTPEEDEEIQRKAKSVGLTVTSFIRKQTLTGKVIGQDTGPLLAHIERLGEIAYEFEQIKNQPHPYHWMYEQDLERIEERINEILETERHLMRR